MKKLIPTLEASIRATAGLAESAASAKLTTAGMRGARRNAIQTAMVAMKTPNSTLGEATMIQTLKGWDWSHKVSHANSGGDSSFNGVWELAGPNRARGAANMTGREAAAARFHGIANATPAATRCAALSATRGAALAGAISLASRMRAKGTWNPRELERRDWALAGRDSAIGAGVSFAITAGCAAFPVAAPVITAASIAAAITATSTAAVHMAKKSGRRLQYDTARSLTRCDNLLSKYA